MYPLFAITVIFNVAVQIIIIILGKMNPGILPKILPKF
jgi:hypothetical protein